jgi:hypothetical protein
VSKQPSDAVWTSVQQFPDLWSRLTTTGGAHHVERRPGSDRSIDVGNVIHADSLVLGLPVAMNNVVTTVVEGRMFHMSVRAVGARFESEVEASIEPWPEGTLLVWRQGYPESRLLSRWTARVLARREAEEASRILELWASEVRLRRVDAT